MSSPAPVSAEIHTCVRSPRRSTRGGVAARSVLLCTTSRGRSAGRLASIAASSGCSASTASRASTITSARSARRIAAHVRSMPRRSISSSRLAQAGGVDDGQRDPGDLHRPLDGVARRAGHRRHDRGVLAHQPVEQARLADVGSADQHDDEPARQPYAGRCAPEQRGQRCAERRELACGIGGAQELDVLVGKIEGRLGEHAQLRDGVDQRADFARELAREAAHRRARRRCRGGLDVVGHALRLREVELAVQERPARELAGLREARTELEAAPEHEPERRAGCRGPAVRARPRR